MGTDIHFFVEQRNENGRWQAASSEGVDRVGRNYTLFGLLADVRNGRGFAGCDIGDRVEPLFANRGIPNDLSPEVLAEHDSWGGYDIHSHTWASLQELENVAWDEIKIVHRGYVSAKVYKEFLEKGQPSSWAGMVGGMQVKIVSNEEMTQILQKCGESEAAKSATEGDLFYYTQVEWSVSAAGACEHFVKRIIPALQALRAANGGREVRTVFWFDN